MSENKNKKDMCERGPELISYIYNECSSADRVRFRSHLQECQICTSDLSGFSVTRSSIMEWRTECFEKLSEREFQMPSIQTSPATTGSWNLFISRLIGLTSNNRLAFASSAAILVAVFGISIVWVTGSDDRPPKIVTVPQAVDHSAEVGMAEPISPSNVESTNINNMSTRLARRSVSSSIPAVRSDSHRKTQTGKLPDESVVGKNKNRKIILDSNISATRLDTPSLGVELPEEDRLLRLSDLFDAEDSNQ